MDMAISASSRMREWGTFSDGACDAWHKGYSPTAAAEPRLARAECRDTMNIQFHLRFSWLELPANN